MAIVRCGKCGEWVDIRTARYDLKTWLCKKCEVKDDKKHTKGDKRDP